MSFALQPSRSLLGSALSLGALSSSEPLRWALPSLQGLLELIPPFLLAVPKKKVSHSRKSMRSANKGLKDKQNIVNCPACGAPKLAHHLCQECYMSLTRERKIRERIIAFKKSLGGKSPDEAAAADSVKRSLTEEVILKHRFNPFWKKP